MNLIGESGSIISLPKIADPRGNLSFAENQTQLPFEIKRTYWIYDVPVVLKGEGMLTVKTQSL